MHYAVIMNPCRAQMGVGCWIEYGGKCVWCVTFSYSTQSHNAQSPLAHHAGKGRFLFQFENLSHRDMLSVCSAISPENEVDRLSRGRGIPQPPYYQKGADMPRKPLYWLFTSPLYCMWEQHTTFSPGASLSTELREFGKSVVCAMQTKRKAPKPNE